MNSTQTNFVIVAIAAMGCFCTGIFVGSARSERNPRRNTTVAPSLRCSDNQQTSCSLGNVRVESFCYGFGSFITQRTERLIREGYTPKGAISGMHVGCQLFLFQRQ